MTTCQPAAAKYQQAFMLAGGGHQYAALLGRYQAIIDAGIKPDVLIATCGGAIVANLIRSISDAEQRLDWISSEEMHAFWKSQVSGPGNKLHKVLYSALIRKMNNNVSDTLPDLFQSWLFDFSNAFPTLPKAYSGAPDLVTIGTQLNYQETQVGLESYSEIFSEAIFCNSRSAYLLAEERSTISVLSEKVASKIEIYTDIVDSIAMRISVADCYYYPPVEVCNHEFIGGLINLFPIEIAQALANNVIAERKPNFDTHFASPAIKHVFGFDPQIRLEQFHAQKNITWLKRIDSLNNVSPENLSIKKKIQWLRNKVSLDVGTYRSFKKQVLAQYQAGYELTIKGNHYNL